MISVNNLSKSYNGQRVFSSLNFSVNKGEVLGIIGGNGSGKSTLLKILSKISLPDSGDILISPDISIDYLGHENMFYEEMSIEENIAFFTKFNSTGTSEESNSKLKKSLGLEDIYMNKMYELSYGQAKKSGLYRIVLNNADLILLDEPFSGLDKKSVNNLIAIIQELTSNNKSLVISSNIIEIIESIATSTINMDNFITSFNFLSEDDNIGNNEVVSNTTTYKFDSENSLQFKTSKDLKNDFTEYYNLIYSYETDCIIASAEFNKKFYRES